MKVTTGINWDAVRAAMDQQEWQEPMDYGCDMEQRSVFLGTVFSVMPSGKYYMPWACSNLDVCPHCKGHGSRPVAKRRTVKKWQKRYDQIRQRAQKLGLYGRPFLASKLGRNNALLKKATKGTYRGTKCCDQCGGLGSMEAYHDQLFRETLEEEADQHGYSIENGEGDPCDMFICEYREVGCDDE